MEKQKLIYVESKALFSPSSVSNKAIVFIKDTKEIWTHGVYFSCSGAWATPITLSLTGDTTGSVSIDGSGNASIATTTTYLSGTTGIADANNAANTQSQKIAYYPRIGSSASNLFPVTNNANAILSLNVHDYSYTHLLGFSSNGNIYHRRRSAGTWETSWKTILNSSNYTNFHHTFASLTNKPTTISGYGITDSIPIIKGGEVTADTDLSTLGMTTSGAKLSVFHSNDSSIPDYMFRYSNALMFRSTIDTYAAISIDYALATVTFIGGRNTETITDNVPRWWYRLLGASGQTYNLANIQTAINNLGSTYLPLTGGTLTDTLILKAGAFTASNSNSYSGGRYQAVAKPNMRLIGDSTYGLSTIEFVSLKGDTSINKPSDSGFIQFLPYGVSALSSVGSHPTLKTSGETNALVLGVTNDSDDIIVLLSPNVSGLRHACGTTEYYLPHVATSTTTANKPLVSTTTAHVYTLGDEYLPLKGGTMTGLITLWSSNADAANTGGLNANNSNIYGLNSLYFADASETAAEGINFYRSSTTVDSLWGSNGNLFWTPNRTYGLAGTSYYVLTSNNYTNYTIPYSKVNVTNGALGAFIFNGGLLYNTNFVFRYFNNPDTLTNPKYLLIAKLVNYKNSDSSLVWTSYGLSGLMTIKRGGYVSSSGCYNITAWATVGPNNGEDSRLSISFMLVSVYIIPVIVLYESEYYLAFQCRGSSSDIYFYGYTSNLLSSPISVNDGSLVTVVKTPEDTTSTHLYYYNAGDPKKFLHEGNYSNYALPLSGGTLTGTLTSSHITPRASVTYNIGTTSVYYNNIYALYFKRKDSSNSYVLLGGGGHKLLSDLSMSHTHSYLPLSGGTMTGNIKLTIDSAHISDTSGYYIFGSVSASNTAAGMSGLAAIYAGADSKNMVLRTSGDNLYHYNHSKSARYLILDTNNYSSYALPLSGGTMTGALNFANNTWNKVGDDAYMGDCNVPGMIGIKGSNAATPGFVMYNNSGNLLGKLYASGSDLYWSGVKLLTSTSSAQEAYLSWGGRNLANNSSPIDTILEPSLGANRLAFLSPDAINIEYSQDGGTTWLNYNATDAQKVCLFCGGGNYSGFYLGGNGSTDPSIDRTPWRLRVTISVIGYSLYCLFIKFLIYTTDVGNTTYCLLLGRKYSDYQNNVDTWVTFLTARIAGWSGWNTINHPNGITLPHTANYAQLRFEFYMTSLGTTGRASIISRIMGFAHKCWAWPSNLAGYGNIYSYDWQLNVTFPAKVTATGGFSGNLTGDVTGNLIGNASTASNISTVNPILALPFEKNTIQVVSNPLGALAELLGTAAAITHALRFNWYNTAYEIGNVRGGASNSLGFGVTYGNNNLCLLVKTNGTYSPYGFIGDLTGNAASANKWAIARTITLTGDVTGSVSLDGSSNVTLTTTTSGSGTSTFLKCPDKRNSYPALIVTSGGNIGASFTSASKIGISGDGSYYDTLIIRGYGDHTGGNENAIMFSKNTSSVYHSLYAFGSTTTWGTLYKFLDSGNYKSYAPTLSGEGATGTWGINISGTANKVANALTLLLNGGTTSGTNKFVYDGSSAYTVNITPDSIGAAASSHTHDYLPLSGGTISSSSYGPLIIERSGSSTLMAAIKFKNASGDLGSIGIGSVNGDLLIYNAGISAYRTILDSGNSSISENTTNKTCTIKINGTSKTVSSSTHTHNYLPLAGGTLGSSSANTTELRTLSSTAALRIMSYSDSTNYILSGNSAFNGNANLKITGYNNVTGTNLYFKFSNIYCRENNYINIDSGNYGSYALPLSGGTLTGTLNTANIYPTANAGFNIGSTSSYYNIMYAYYFKKYGSDDNYLLLGGGGHKAISDFAPNNVATLSSSGMGNSDLWTLVFEKSYPANYWYAPTTMFYIRSGTAGCGILCFYNYWASGTQLDDYEREVWFFGALKSETGITFGGANRDINDFFRIYIDKANFKYCIYYNRYNDLSLKILELLFFTVPEPGEYLSTGSLRSSFFTNSTTVVDLPTESSTLVRVPIKTTYNHDRTIKTTKSVYASSFYENSDIRLKENIKRIDLSDLTKLVDLVQFNFKDDGTKKYGVIAQLLELVGLQNLVYENNGNKAVDYISLLVLETLRLRNEIKELKEKLDKKELSS